MILPPEALPPSAELAPAFTQPTCRRSVAPLLAAIPTAGRRAAANLLRTRGGRAPGHRTDYHRARSRAPRSAPDLGGALAGSLPRRHLTDRTAVPVGGDTGDGHP